MRAAGVWKRSATALVVLWCLAAAQSTLFAWPPPSPGTAEEATSPAGVPRERLCSPRETLRTLYFAAIAYDFRPALVDEAVACLDLGPDQTADPAEAVRLAIDLEQVLRTLCVPVHSVPLKPQTGMVSVVDSDGFKVVLVQGTDGLWRFSRDTVGRIPAMSQAALARYRDLQGERARLRDGYTDPAASVRTFLIDTVARDFYSAARCLDLGAIDQQQRSEKGPLLARQLAFVIQRRGWLFLQEVPSNPSGLPYTWHADRTGRIVLERVRGDDGKDAWLFSRRTVRNIPAMYEQAKDRPADPRFVRLGVALPALGDGNDSGLGKRPASVPARLGSPRALLEGFFKVMDAAETRDSRLVDALAFLDLDAIPAADRRTQGTKLASKLDAVLRKIHVELSALPNDWNAPPQVLGKSQGVQIELVRQRDGCWRFSRDTVSGVPAFYDTLTGRDRAEQQRADTLDSARETMCTFLKWMRKGDLDQSANCLDLSHYRPGTREQVGPLLAYKLKYVMDRIGRVYIQEVPDSPDGPRYVFYRGELGRIVIARKAEGERKGSWLFTQETVALLGRMFMAVRDLPVAEASADAALAPPTLWQAPALWVRFRVPAGLQTTFWKLQLYQWLGVVTAILVSVLVPRLLLPPLLWLFALVLRKSGSVLTGPFVVARLRPLTWVVGWWLLFGLLALLDLPARTIDTLRPLQTFGLAALLGWLGVRLVDLATAVYTNSELLRPHRSLSDMVVPVTMRTLKGGLVLVVAVYLVYQFGEGESLGRFLTGLGVAGLAASLAAQDAMKNFFSTLLLIGERTFKIGDRINVGGQEGVVEQVGFRATRLRTPDGSQLTVPNATLASAAIDNLSSRSFSRCRASLLVNSDTSAERVLALRDRLRDWLQGHPHVQPDKVQVSVNRLTDKGVEVAVDLCLSGVSGDDEKALKEEINCHLLRLSEELPSVAGRAA
jgi:MscS family membrane protein